MPYIQILVNDVMSSNEGEIVEKEVVKEEEPKEEKEVKTEKEAIEEPIAEISTILEEPPFETLLKAYMDAKGISGPKKQIALTLTKLLKECGVDPEKDISKILIDFSKKMSMARELKKLGGEQAEELANIIAAKATDDALEKMGAYQTTSNDEEIFKDTITILRRYIFPYTIALKFMNNLFPESNNKVLEKFTETQNKILETQTKILENLEKRIESLENKIIELRPFTKSEPTQSMVDIMKSIGEFISSMGEAYKSILQSIKESGSPKETEKLEKKIEELKESITNEKIRSLEEKIEEYIKSGTKSPDILRLERELKKEDRKYQLMLAKLLHDLEMEKLEKQERLASKKAMERGIAEIMNSVISAMEEEESSHTQERSYIKNKPLEIACPECKDTLHIIPGVTKKAICPSCGKEFEVKEVKEG